MANPIEPLLRPFRRIAPRLALIAALAILAFSWLQPFLTRWIYEALPADFWPETITSAVVAREVGDAINRGGIETLGADPGIASLQQDLRERAQLVFLLDARGGYAYRPAALSGTSAEVFGRATRFRVPVADGEPATAFVSYSPLPVSPGRPAMLVGRMSVYGQDFLAEEAAEDVVSIELADSSLLESARLRERQSEDRYRTIDRVRTVVELAAASLLAVLLGLLTSFLVTRRLRRLAGMVAAGAGDDEGLPGPFQASGTDEVAVLAAALETMRGRITDLVRDVRARDAARREWIAQVSHDLRTPLTSLAISLRRARETADAATVELLSGAEHDTARLQSLAQDLLDLSRLDLPDSLQPEPLLPMELAEAAIRSVAPQAEDRGIDLGSASDGPIPELDADGQKLLRALENLLANAVRHAATRVRLRVGADPTAVRFEVVDDGGGFEGPAGPVDIERLAEERAGRNDFGLGLLVALRVAQAHGGSLSASNEPDGLTVVRLGIPRRA